MSYANKNSADNIKKKKEPEKEKNRGEENKRKVRGKEGDVKIKYWDNGIQEKTSNQKSEEYLKLYFSVPIRN